MRREATRNEAWDLILRDAILAPALGLPDAAKLARVCRDSRAALQAAWRERCLAEDADELECMYLMATRAGKTVHASMLLAAARERGLLLSSVVLGRVLVESAGAGNLEGVNALLAAGVEKRELLMWTTRGVSCLFAGAQKGHPEVVRALLAAATAKSSLWKSSTYTSPVTSTRLARRIISPPHSWTITSITATRSALICVPSPGRAS